MDIATLYKRDARNNILEWTIEDYDVSKLRITYGILGKNQHVEIINKTLTKVNEFVSRIQAKRKEGYKSLFDLYDNAPAFMDDSKYLGKYLNTYLPKYNTTSEGFVLPMLAKTLEDNKPFKDGIMLGQWKINGLRCIIGATKADNLFNTISFTYHSREGVDWTPLFTWMDEIIMTNLSTYIIELMVEEGVCLDGELYIPNYSVNDINSFVKNTDSAQHFKLQYWCYDLCMENASAKNRNKILVENINPTKLNSKEEHLNNTKQFILLPTSEVVDYDNASDYRDSFINIGFEGLILRNPNSEYAFGKRNKSMYKFKKKYDGRFKICDIRIDKRGLPIFLIENDINDEHFECTYNGSYDSQQRCIANKDKLIGSECIVEYRERSGVKEVPFHAKLVKFLRLNECN